MKNIVFLAIIAASLSACAVVSNQQSQSSNQDAPPSIGMANPASKYCVEQGGRSEIVKEAQGEVGYCHLKDGQKVEEWALFRQSQAQCIDVEAKKLIGQSDLADAQLKQLTKAEHIRRVGPNQAMTMDYRSDRLTLLIEPSTKKILQASCG
ncbi:I78 family peptidase inhibitor [Acinetobacter sp. CFCC 10889]|uniref:I78 family peptidase inhibitor n=1 Tax=Acinetobacter sp. CFCC 10889 TaxID=1775557 RepID=UPI000DD0E7F9|nr:I78 family peptidase inhibitor [Acinetobacter sp. CFCC 10889]